MRIWFPFSPSLGGRGKRGRAVTISGWKLSRATAKVEMKEAAA